LEPEEPLTKVLAAQSAIRKIRKTEFSIDNFRTSEIMFFPTFF
jgi:hypothetical protein